MTAQAIHPQSIDVGRLHQQAQQLIDQRDFARAQQVCLQLLKTERQHAGSLFLLGVIAAELQRFSNATEFIRQAIVLEPNREEYYAQLGRCLAMLRRDREAAEAADRALALTNGNPLTLDTCGVVYSRTGYHKKAAEAFRQAVNLAPGNPAFQFNLASSLQFNGDFDGAEQAYEATIRLSPRFYKSHSAVAYLRRQTPEKNHIVRLESLLSAIHEDVDGELHLRHALAKEYEDLGDYAQSFGHLVAGNQRKRQTLEYCIDRDRHIFDAVRKHMTAEFLSHGPDGYLASEPIFVVGMPRTGTTLVERIITSHSAVMSAGELQNFPIELKRAAGTRSNQVLDVDTVTKGLNVDFSALGKTYIESTRPATARLPHFVDKMPLNFLYIGFIRLALPNARIICLRRNPMDTCLSNFRQLFSLNFSYYNYAYDLEETGWYYVLFHRLMEHWHSVMPGHILEVEYEQLVADQKNESQRIIEFCKLDWEDACLSFDENESPVATASSAQVREPIYRTSVGRWKRYENELEPLKNFFESNGIAV
jgi:Flp pilus assembly protein TadD